MYTIAVSSSYMNIHVRLSPSFLSFFLPIHSLAKSQSYDDGLIDIFTQYGDHLYRFMRCSDRSCPASDIVALCTCIYDKFHLPHLSLPSPIPRPPFPSPIFPFVFSSLLHCLLLSSLSPLLSSSLILLSSPLPSPPLPSPPLPSPPLPSPPLPLLPSPPLPSPPLPLPISPPLPFPPLPSSPLPLPLLPSPPLPPLPSSLLSKGDYDGATAQYILTIGKLEPSYVIRKVDFNPTQG